MENVKLCFIASSGGHLEQLMRLKPLMEKYPSFVVTEKTPYDVKIGEKKVYYLKQVNRREWAFAFLMIWNAILSVRIYHREKPTVVICTGALATVSMCLLMKLMRKKIVFIESFSKTRSKTLTGKLMYKFADQFYVQWKSMLDVYPNAIWKGGIY